MQDEDKDFIIDVTADNIDDIIVPVKESDISAYPEKGKFYSKIHKDWDEKYHGG